MRGEKARIHATVFAIVGLFSATAHASGRAPELMSPIGKEAPAKVSGRCPTFHWAPASGALGYELVVYRAGGEAPEEHYRLSLPPGSSWTPSGAQCLTPGQRYAWSVGALLTGSEKRFSEVGLFEIGLAPSVGEVELALSVLARFVASESEPSSAIEQSEGPRAPPGAPPSPPGARPVDSGADLAATPTIVTDGAVQAEDFTYGTPQIRSQAVPAALFRQLEANREINYSLGYSYLSGIDPNYNAIAPIYMPQGAKIQLVTCWAYDNALDESGIWEVSLMRRPYTNSGLTKVTSLEIDTAGQSTILQSNSLGPVGSGGSDMEFLQLTYTRDFGSINSAALRFYGCRVDYEVTTVSTP